MPVLAVAEYRSRSRPSIPEKGSLLRLNCPEIVNLWGSLGYAFPAWHAKRHELPAKSVGVVSEVVLPDSVIRARMRDCLISTVNEQRPVT